MYHIYTEKTRILKALYNSFIEYILTYQDIEVFLNTRIIKYTVVFSKPKSTYLIKINLSPSSSFLHDAPLYIFTYHTNRSLQQYNNHKQISKYLLALSV